MWARFLYAQDGPHRFAHSRARGLRPSAARVCANPLIEGTYLRSIYEPMHDKSGRRRGFISLEHALQTFCLYAALKVYTLPCVCQPCHAFFVKAVKSNSFVFVGFLRRKVCNVLFFVLRRSRRARERANPARCFPFTHQPFASRACGLPVKSFFAAEVSAACGGNSEPEQGPHSDFCEAAQGRNIKSASATRPSFFSKKEQKTARPCFRTDRAAANYMISRREPTTEGITRGLPSRCRGPRSSLRRCSS